MNNESAAVDSTKTIMSTLQADNLLRNSFILTQIESLRTNLRYKTDGQLISFDEMYLSLENQVDGLPKLKLAPVVPTGTENQYIVQLISTLEQVFDDSERVGQKVIHYEAKLKDAASQIKKVGSAFGVWYTLAAADVLTANYGGLIIPIGQLKELAGSEFTRLMDNTDVMVSSLISAVKATTDRLKLHKKTQQDKFNLGKDQANASWTSSFPAFGNTISESDSTQLTDHSEEEVVEEEMPAFVSNAPKVGTTATWKDHKGDTVMAAFVEIKSEEKFEPIKFEPSPESMAPLFRKSANGGVETREGITVVRGDENGLPKLGISDMPITGIETFTGQQGPSLTVAVVPDAEYDRLKAAVQDGPVSVDQFKALLSDEPVTIKKTKEPKEVKARRATEGLSYRAPAANEPPTPRVKDGQAEKIKCVVCDRRIRIGQVMFERDGGWAHVWDVDCAQRDMRADDRQPGLMTGFNDVVNTTLRKSEDGAPPTKSLESGTLVRPELNSIDYTNPAAPGSIPIGTVAPDTLVAQMIKEHPVLLTPNPTMTVKLATNAHVSDELNDLIEKARKITPTAAEHEEQRRGFAAANVALDSGRPVEEVRKEVDAAAEAMKTETSLNVPVQNVPPRKRIAFLEDDGEVI